MRNDTMMLYSSMLTGALFHGTSNVWRRRVLTQKVHEDYVAAVSMLGAALVGLAGSFAVHGVPVIQSGFTVPFLAAAVLNVFFWKFDVRASKLEDVSRVIPLSAFSPLTVTLFSYLYLRELPTLWGGVAMGGIMLGSYVLNLKGEHVGLPRIWAQILPKGWQVYAEQWLGPVLRLTSSRGAWCAIAAWGLFGSPALVISKDVVLRSTPLFRTGATFAFVALWIYLDSRRRGAWQQIPKDRRTFVQILLVGVALGLADAFYNVAYYHDIVPYIGALKQVQVLVTIVLAHLFLREGYFGQRLLGAAVMAAGAVLLKF